MPTWRDDPAARPADAGVARRAAGRPARAWSTSPSTTASARSSTSRPPAKRGSGAARRPLLAQRHREDRAVPGDRARRWQAIATRLDEPAAARRRDRRDRRRRPAARLPAHPGPHSPDVAGRHRARGARSAGRARSCSTCCATATRTCAASRSPRAGCACRSASGRRARRAPAGPPERDRRRRRPRRCCSARSDEGWEGLIVKDGQSLYHSGRRTPAWRKMKLLKQQEFVVGGWTEPRQTRAALRLAARRLLRRRQARCAGPAASARASIRRSSIASAKLLRAAEGAREPVRRRVQDDGEGRTGSKPDTRRRSAVHGVDERRPAAAAGVPGHARPTRRRATSGAKSRRRRSRRRPLPPSGRYRRNARVTKTVGGRFRGDERRPETTRRGLALVDRLHELEDTRKDGDLALPERRHAARDESREGLLADARHHQGRSAAVLRRSLAAASAGRRRPAAGHEALPERHREAGVLPAAPSRSAAAGRAARGAARGHRADRRRGPARSADRRIAHDAALHDAARGDLAGPVVLARVAIRSTRTTPRSISIPATAPTSTQVLDVARWVKDELDRLRHSRRAEDVRLARSAHLHPAAADARRTRPASCSARSSRRSSRRSIRRSRRSSAW